MKIFRKRCDQNQKNFRLWNWELKEVPIYGKQKDLYTYFFTLPVEKTADCKLLDKENTVLLIGHVILAAIKNQIKILIVLRSRLNIERRKNIRVWGHLKRINGVQ